MFPKVLGQYLAMGKPIIRHRAATAQMGSNFLSGQLVGSTKRTPIWGRNNNAMEVEQVCPHNYSSFKLLYHLECKRAVTYPPGSHKNWESLVIILLWHSAVEPDQLRANWSSSCLRLDWSQIVHQFDNDQSPKVTVNFDLANRLNCYMLYAIWVVTDGV